MDARVCPSHILALLFFMLPVVLGSLLLETYTSHCSNGCFRNIEQPGNDIDRGINTFTIFVGFNGAAVPRTHSRLELLTNFKPIRTYPQLFKPIRTNMRKPSTHFTTIIIHTQTRY